MMAPPCSTLQMEEDKTVDGRWSTIDDGGYCSSHEKIRAQGRDRTNTWWVKKKEKAKRLNGSINLSLKQSNGVRRTGWDLWPHRVSWASGEILLEDAATHILDLTGQLDCKCRQLG